MGQSTLFKRAQLRRLYIKAVAEGLTLLACLEALLIARVDETANGKTLISTIGSGTGVTFEIPEGQTPVSMVEMCEELMTLREQALEYLGGTGTDAAVYAEMLALLQPRTEVYSDFSGIRTEAAA